MMSRFPNQNSASSLLRVCVFACSCASAASAGAQEPGAEPQERHAKADASDAVAAPRPDRLASMFTWAQSKMKAASPSEGFYPELGGMITGAGLSIGPGYRHQLFSDRMTVDASAAVSWRRYTMMQSQLVWRFSDRVSAGAHAKYQDFTQINFFGIGNNSRKDDRTDYRLKDLDTLGFATIRVNSWFSVTGRGGLLRRVDIGRGRSTLYPSTDDRFDEISAPSLTRQPGYLHADVAVDADTRNVPGYPTRGGRYWFSVAAYHDRDFSRYSFRRVEADAAHYIPLGKSVVALRGRLDLSQTGAGQHVPFYLLPALGGSKSLRGYLDYRFRDRDLLLLNAEYRWPIVRALDAAVFYDAGSVAPTAGALWHRLNTDYGVGVRFHTAAHMLMRFDVARGREGTRALVTFSAPLSVPNRSVVPYVP